MHRETSPVSLDDFMFVRGAGRQATQVRINNGEAPFAAATYSGKVCLGAVQPPVLLVDLHTYVIVMLSRNVFFTKSLQIEPDPETFVLEPRLLLAATPVLPSRRNANWRTSFGWNT